MTMDVFETLETPTEQRVRLSSEIATRIGPAAGFERSVLAAAAFAVLAEGLAPRDSTVVAEARARAAMATDEAIEGWAQVNASVLEELPSATFELWIQPLRLIGARSDELWVTGPGRVRTWVGRRYIHVLGDAARSLTPFVGIRLVAPTKRVGR